LGRRRQGWLYRPIERRGRGEETLSSGCDNKNSLRHNGSREKILQHFLLLREPLLGVFILWPVGRREGGATTKGEGGARRLKRGRGQQGRGGARRVKRGREGRGEEAEGPALREREGPAPREREGPGGGRGVRVRRVKRGRASREGERRRRDQH
jgi:hypothetical protein